MGCTCSVGINSVPGGEGRLGGGGGCIHCTSRTDDDLDHTYLIDQVDPTNQKYHIDHLDHTDHIDRIDHL